MEAHNKYNKLQSSDQKFSLTAKLTNKKLKKHRQRIWKYPTNS